MLGRQASGTCWVGAGAAAYIGNRRWWESTSTDDTEHLRNVAASLLGWGLLALALIAASLTLLAVT